MANKRKTANAKEPSSTTAKTPSKPLIQLSEEEQWRLINESGVLHQVAAAEGAPSSEGMKQSKEEDSPLAEEIFDAVVLIIPFTFLLVMMEMCVGLFCYLLPNILTSGERPGKSDPPTVWKSSYLENPHRQTHFRCAKFVSFHLSVY